MVNERYTCPTPVPRRWIMSSGTPEARRYLWRRRQDCCGQRKTHLPPFCGSCLQASPRHIIKQGCTGSALEQCHHSRAHKAAPGLSQGHWQVMVNRKRRSKFMSFLRRVDEVTAPGLLTERARWREWLRVSSQWAL